MTRALIPNIGPRGRQQRRKLGMIALVAGVLLTILIVGLGAPRGWRAVAFVPLWISALGYFQARDKT